MVVFGPDQLMRPRFPQTRRVFTLPLGVVVEPGDGSGTFVLGCNTTQEVESLIRERFPTRRHFTHRKTAAPATTCDALEADPTLAKALLITSGWATGGHHAPDIPELPIAVGE